MLQNQKYEFVCLYFKIVKYSLSISVTYFEREETSEILPSIPAHHHVADGAGQAVLNLVLDVGGRDILATGGDDDLLDPADHLVEALLVPPDQVPGV